MTGGNPFGRQAKGLTVAALQDDRGQRYVALVLYDALGHGIGTLTTDARGAWDILMKLQAALLVCDTEDSDAS